MGKSALVFISHSSDDKESFIEPIVSDLEDCFLNVWIDKRKIIPGDNLRKSILRDGLDKADVVLIFFTQKSLRSSWVDREIKHVLRGDTKSDDNYDLNKIISIFDTKETYDAIADRYPELTDDLLHLMPENYDKIHLGKLISAIWSKYFSLQGRDILTQKIILEKDKQLFEKDKEIYQLKTKVVETKIKNSATLQREEFQRMLNSGKIDDFIKFRDIVLKDQLIDRDKVKNITEAIAFGLIDNKNTKFIAISNKGKEFFKWYIMENPSKVVPEE